MNIPIFIFTVIVDIIIIITAETGNNSMNNHCGNPRPTYINNTPTGTQEPERCPQIVQNINRKLQYRSPPQLLRLF